MIEISQWTCWWNNPFPLACIIFFLWHTTLTIQLSVLTWGWWWRLVRNSWRSFWRCCSNCTLSVIRSLQTFILYDMVEIHIAVERTYINEVYSSTYVWGDYEQEYNGDKTITFHDRRKATYKLIIKEMNEYMRWCKKLYWRYCTNITMYWWDVGGGF